MSRVNKIDIVKNLVLMGSELQSSGYNIVDIFIEPLYLQCLSERDHQSLFSKIKKKISFLKSLLRGLIRLNIMPNKKVRVILHASTIAHIRQLNPIANELKKNNVSYCWTVTKGTLAIELMKLSEDFILLKGYYVINRTLNVELLRDSEKLLNKSRIEENVKTVWRKLLNNRIYEVVSLIKFFEAAIVKMKPEMIVVGNDLTVEGRVAATVFKQKLLHSVSIQHGDVSGMLEGSHIVNDFFVYGTIAKTVLEKINTFTNFVVSGAPYLDNSNIDRSNQSSIRQRFKIKDSYILVAFSGPGNNTSHFNHKLQVESIYILATTFPEFLIVIKLHSKDSLEHYKTPFNLEALSNVRIVKNEFSYSIFSWLVGSKLLITGASTTAIEAMSLAIPVVVLDFNNEYHDIDFVKRETSIVIKRKDLVLSAIGPLLKGQAGYEDIKSNAAEYAESYFYKNADSTASAVIASEIHKKLRTT